MGGIDGRPWSRPEPRREAFFPAVLIFWLTTLVLADRIKVGHEPFLGMPFWVGWIAHGLCALWASIYIWRGRSEKWR